jgi:hypothetical protein
VAWLCQFDRLGPSQARDSLAWFSGFGFCLAWLGFLAWLSILAWLGSYNYEIKKLQKITVAFECRDIVV